MKSFKAFFLENLDQAFVNKDTNLDEASKEYHTVHRAASLTSARMKVAAPGDQPTYHRSEKEAIDHLNKKFKKVRDDVWQNNKDQFFFHKKNSPMKEESEQIDEISDKLKARYLDKAVQQRYDFFKEPWDPKKEPKWATPGGKPKKGYYDQPHKVKAREKDNRRGEIIDKTSEKLTGKPHYSQMSTMDKPAVHGNAGDWWKGKKYSKEEVEFKETDLDEAKKPKPGHNASVMSKNISKILSAIKNK